MSQFILPLIIFVVWWINFKKHEFNNINEIKFNYGGLINKIEAFLSPFIFNNSKQDFISILLILLFIFIYRFFYPFKLKFYDKMIIPLLTTLIVIILMPNYLAGMWGADFRYPFIIIISCYKSFYIYDDWKKTNLQYQEFENSLKYLPRGAKVLSILDNKDVNGFDLRTFYHMPALSIPALSIIYRSTFWPPLFTNITPIFPTPKTERLDIPNDSPILSINNLSIIKNENLNHVFRGSYFDIYKIIN